MSPIVNIDSQGLLSCKPRGFARCSSIIHLPLSPPVSHGCLEGLQSVRTQKPPGGTGGNKRLVPVLMTPRTKKKGLGLAKRTSKLLAVPIPLFLESLKDLFHQVIHWQLQQHQGTLYPGTAPNLHGCMLHLCFGFVQHLASPGHTPA